MLKIAKTHALMGKISNNLEKHGDEDVTAFDIPVSGLKLDLEQVKTLLDDPYADRWLFNETRSGAVEPVTRALQPRVLKDSFEGAVVVFTIGKSVFELDDCKIQAVTLEPENGGITDVSLKLRVRPESDKQILALLGHQNREVQLEIAEAKVAVKGGKKQIDAFDDKHPDPDAQHKPDGKSTKASDFEKDVRKQLEGRAGAAH